MPVAPSETMRAPPLTSLEVSYGLGIGIDRSIPALRRSTDATLTEAVEAALLRALRRPPCLISFSGGVDSSALLGLAVRLARQHGLDDPVAATLAFPDLPEADEDEWQQLVLRHVGSPRQMRFEFTDELGVLGPYAQALLRRHGLIWPFNLHMHAPIIEAAAGGSVVTGFGGDELGRANQGLYAEWLVARRRLRRRRDVPALALRFSPRPLNATYEFLRGAEITEGLGYFTSGGRRRLRWAIANEFAAPFGLSAIARRYMWRLRVIQLCRQNFEAIAAPSDVEVVHPFVEPATLQAFAEQDVQETFGDRAKLFQRIFGDAIPREIYERTSKAAFTSALWTQGAFDFAREWSGQGLDTSLVDPDAVRREWLKPEGSIMTTTMLQAAWLTDAGLAPATA